MIFAYFTVVVAVVVVVVVANRTQIFVVLTYLMDVVVHSTHSFVAFSSSQNKLVVPSTDCVNVAVHRNDTRALHLFHE